MKNLKALIFAITVTLPGTSVFAQPTPAPTTGDAPCAATPTGAVDTVDSKLDGEGYFSLFNGKNFTGWWNSCQTTHSGGSAQGAIFRVDSTRKAIYSTQRGTSTGGVLMTKKKFGNYEIVFDLWPDFGNDGGLFNRTTPDGHCFQTVLDYIDVGSLGGSYGEHFNHTDYRPFTFSGSENTISIPGKGANWTQITAKLDPASFGCQVTGCTQADWRNLWNMDDWNQVRIKFYGGLTAGSQTHMESFFRKVGSNVWVPIFHDDTQDKNTPIPAGFIGLQVHGAGRFGGAKGTWYRNIKWRPLDDTGKPLTSGTTGLAPKTGGLMGNGWHVTSNSLVGNIDRSHTIFLRDLNGRMLDVLSGQAGAFDYSLTSGASVWRSVEVKTSAGTQYGQVNQAAK
jgi:hypothetical protein